MAVNAERSLTYAVTLLGLSTYALRSSPLPTPVTKC
jgi:hypothetical protein